MLTDQIFLRKLSTIPALQSTLLNISWEWGPHAIGSLGAGRLCRQLVRLTWTFLGGVKHLQRFHPTWLYIWPNKAPVAWSTRIFPANLLSQNWRPPDPMAALLRDTLLGDYSEPCYAQPNPIWPRKCLLWYQVHPCRKNPTDLALYDVVDCGPHGDRIDRNVSSGSSPLCANL